MFPGASSNLFVPHFSVGLEGHLVKTEIVFFLILYHNSFIVIEERLNKNNILPQQSQPFSPKCECSA